MNPRCPNRSCPVRWRSGHDRPCAEHQGEQDAIDVRDGVRRPLNLEWTES